MNTQTLLDNVATINKDNGIFVDAKEFLKTLRFVAVAVCKGWRATLKNVHVRVGKDEITLEATDSHILTRVKVAAAVSDELVGRGFVISGKFAKNLSKTPTKHGKELMIKPLFYEDTETTVKVIFLDGNGETFIDDLFGENSYYPEVDRLIPERKDFGFEVQKKELLPILKKLKKTTDAKSNYKVHLEILDNSTVKIDDEEIQQRNLYIKDAYKVRERTGRNFEINFNVKFLVDLVQKCDNREFLKFGFSGTLRPFTISRENGGLGLVCPIRLY